MAAKIINGSVIAIELLNKVKEVVSQKETVPGLAIVYVNSPVARTSIADLKKRTCQIAGINCEVHALDSLSNQSEVVRLIEKLNKNPKIQGINIHPMPNHISHKEVVSVIDPKKDVEGIHPHNMGNFLLGEKKNVPFTPRGIIKLIESTGINLKGKRAVVVGRSQHVGLPAAFLMLEQHATVTLAHSRSWGLEEITRRADVLVVAAGHPEMITGDMVKPGAVVIDVGINVVAGKLVGDVEHESVSQVASWITPVTGGVGPVAVAMMLLNLVGVK